MSTQQCPQCQSIIEPDSNFCSSCGQKIPKPTPDNRASNGLGTLLGVGLAGLTALALMHQARAHRQAPFNNPTAHHAQQMYRSSTRANPEIQQMWADAIEGQQQANAAQWKGMQRGHKAIREAMFGSWDQRKEQERDE